MLFVHSSQESLNCAVARLLQPETQPKVCSHRIKE
jgi:hypothetical protein